MPRALTVEYLHEIIAAFNSRDADRIVAYFTDDCTFYPSRGPTIQGERVHGKAAVRKYLADRFRVIPDMRWEPIYDYVADANRAVSVWIVRGRHLNGEVIERQGVDLWEFRDGLVHNKDTYWKVVERP
jgi:ketosteroid isomerase-like protein